MSHMPNQNFSHAEEVSSATKTLLVIAWLWAGVPLGWGVFQTVVKATPLFQPRKTDAPKEPGAPAPAKPNPSAETKKPG
jgi:hypothetical protein